ncbi:hypothetical protein [Nocardioides marinquilinus]|uniref:hypothetical protein n=1 Tax=Nocardioides marinquilinus TaxID=1210400 RepID=UPI0031E5EE63
MFSLRLTIVCLVAAVVAPLGLSSVAVATTVGSTAAPTTTAVEPYSALPLAQRGRQKCRFAGTSTSGTSTRHCYGWGRSWRGVSVTQPNAWLDYSQRTKDTEMLTLNLRVADFAADGKCAVLRVKKVGYNPYDYFLDGYACGKGTSEVSTFKFTHRVFHLSPGTFRLALCRARMPGGTVTNPRCTNIFKQRFR